MTTADIAVFVVRFSTSYTHIYKYICYITCIPIRLAAAVVPKQNCNCAHNNNQTNI